MNVLSLQENDLAQSAYALVQDWIGSRMQIRFWLSLDKREDCEVLEIIDCMKDKRTFRRSVMIGLRIVWELKHAKVDTLLKEFPQVVDWLKVKLTPPAPSGAGGLDEIINKKLDLILERGITDTALPPSPIAAQPAGLKALAAPAFAMPTFDDDEDLPTVVVNKVASNAGRNFLKSFEGLQ